MTIHSPAKTSLQDAAATFFAQANIGIDAAAKRRRKAATETATLPSPAKTSLLLLLLLFFCLSFGSLAQASAIDMFGFGPVRSALGSTGAASATGTAAAYYNPAAAAFARSTHFALHYTYAQPQLLLNGKETNQDSARGLSAALTIPGKLIGFPLGFSLNFYIPDQRVARIRILPPTRPHFFRFDNQIHRIFATATLAARPHKTLSLGIGVSMLADAAGNGSRFELKLDPARLKDPKSHQADGALDIDLPARFTPVAGILFRPIPQLGFGLTFRGPIWTQVAVDSQAQIDAQILSGDLTIGIRAVNYYTPLQLALGFSFSTCRGAKATLEGTTCGEVPPQVVLQGSAEITWYHWSGAASGMLPKQKVTPNLQGIDLNLPTAQYDPKTVTPLDTVVPRIGLELRIPFARIAALALRAGYYYEASPLPLQTGLLNILDNDRHTITAGLGFVLARAGEVLPQPLSLDFFFQYHLLQERLNVKKNPASIAPTFRSGGQIITAGGGLTLRF